MCGGVPSPEKKGTRVFQEDMEGFLKPQHLIHPWVWEHISEGSQERQKCGKLDVSIVRSRWASIIYYMYMNIFHYKLHVYTEDGVLSEFWVQEGCGWSKGKPKFLSIFPPFLS